MDMAHDAIQAWISAIGTLPDAIIPDIQMPVGPSSVGFTSGLVHSAARLPLLSERGEPGF